MKLTGMFPWFTWPKWGVGEVEEERERGVSQQCPDRKRHNSYNNENLYAYIFVINTVLQNKRDKKGSTVFQTVTAHRSILQTRFRSSGGFCERTEGHRQQKESIPATSADRVQTYLKRKKPLLGKYFWCLQRSVQYMGKIMSSYWSLYMLCGRGSCRFLHFLK